MRIRIAAVLLLVVALSAPSFLEIGAINAHSYSQGTQIIFQYGFEDSTIPDEAQPPHWKSGDQNDGNGSDTWDCDPTSYKKHSGAHSAWCAYQGSTNTKVNGTWTQVPNYLTHRYDQNMSAYLRLSLDVSAYEAVSISFYYWALVDDVSFDFLTVNLEGDLGIWNQAWVQNVTDSSGWQIVTLGIPTNSTRLAFNFTSDGIAGAGLHEGVYIDDLIVMGTDNTPPVSDVRSLPTYILVSDVEVQFNWSDTGGSGVDYVELYFQKDDSGSYLRYTAPNNTAGRWNSSPIIFNSTAVGGDGHYRFYSIATDKFGNIEAVPSVGDAETIVDTTVPWGGPIFAGTAGENGWYKSAVDLTFLPYDETSGLADVQYKVTHRGTTVLDWSPYHLQTVTVSMEGESIVFFNMTDNATNSATRKCYVYIDTVAPESKINLTGEPGENGWYTGSAVTVNITASDNTSGVSSIIYIIDEDTWRNYSGDFLVDEGGYRNISYYAIDEAGNPEPTPATQLLKLDTAGPVCTIIDPPSVANSNLVTLNWQAVDNVSGIAYYETSIDSDEFATLGINSTTLETNLADGRHIFKVRAVDMAGNTGTPAEVTFSVDTNVLSPSGPFGPALDLGIVAVIIVLIVLFLQRRKKLGMPFYKKKEE